MSRRKRTHKAVKRPDLSGLKEALMDDRVWCALGIVQAEDDGGAHFEIVDGELLVDVELQPSEEEVTCVVASPVGGSGVGIFAVPPVGSEVIVAIPDGDIFFQPTIISVLTSGNSASGLSDSTIVIVAPSGGEVLVHDGSGGAQELAYKSDVQAVDNRLSSHIHVTTATVGGGATVGVISPTTEPPATIEGTSVLKGK